MHARAGHLAGRIEARDAASALQIRGDTAHCVVRRRVHGRGRRGDVDAIAQTGFIDPGEAVPNEGRIARGEIQPDVRRAGAVHFRDDGARDHVPGRQILQFVITAHEGLAFAVAQNGAFATQRLRQEEARGVIQMQSRGMKLDEFDIADPRAGTPRHGDAISGGDVGIGGFFEHAAQTAGGQQDRAGPHVAEAILLFLENHGAGRAIAREQQIGNRGIAFELHVRQRGSFFEQCARDFATRGIPVRMQDPVAAVGALAGKGEAETVAIELGAPVDQILNIRRALFDQRVHRRLIAEAVTGIERVLFVERDLIVVTERDRDAALCVFGGGLPKRVLGDYQNAARLRQFNGRAESGDAGADDKKIAVCRQTPILTTGGRGGRGAGAVGAVRYATRRAGRKQ